MNKRLFSPKIIGYYLFNLICIVILLFFDQWTKQLASKNLKDAKAFPIIPKVFELYYLENRGVAFGMMQNQKVFILTMTIVLMAMVLYFLHKVHKMKHSIFARIALILIASGGIGNMIDRILNGFVTDFFSFVLINFPIFNVADIYIVVGTAMVCIYILFFSEEKPKS